MKSENNCNIKSIDGRKKRLTTLTELAAANCTGTLKKLAKQNSFLILQRDEGKYKRTFPRNSIRQRR